jgi:Ca2+-binding RTX toxin-like protein
VRSFEVAMPGPSDQEQLFLEYINEARLNPMANAARYITSYSPLTSSNGSIQNAINYFQVSGSALQAAYNALVAVGPVAWNEALSTAAESHNAAMIAAQQQTHQAPGEPGLGTRLINAGYNFNSAAENVFAYTESVIQGHAGFMIDWGNGPGGMQSPAGHRNSIMNAAYTEVGIAMDAEPSSANPLGPYVVTQDFGARGKLFVLGVAYSDNDNNDFYSIGEGRADLAVQVAARNATSTSSGGYAVEAASGAATITLTGGGLASAVTVTTTISGENIKLDVVDGSTLLTSRSVVVSGPITELRALGVRGLSLTTGAGSQAVIGTQADDTLDGGAGNDNLVGGLGNDTYKVDSAADLVIEGASAGTDTVLASAGHYLFANIEHLTLVAGAGNIFGVGNTLANILTGNANANLLLGGAGDDTVNGGSGDDQLFGEDGIDTLNGEAGIDFIAGGLGNDLIQGGADADNLYGEDGDDTLDGGDSFHTDILTGGAGNDTLDGISGQANPDYDLMDGGAGNDTYWVDTGADLTFESIGGGTDTVHANVTVPNAGVYLYANVENLILEGTTAFGVGNDLANQLTGSASANWLLGGAGSDRIDGKAGNDVLFGEGGADTFVFGAGSGADVIGDFAIAEDVVEFASYFTSFAQAQASFHQNGADGAIDLGGGNLIVLHGVTMANLTAANFTFAAAAEAPKAAPVMEALSLGLEPADVFADHGLVRWQVEFNLAIIP